MAKKIRFEWNGEGFRQILRSDGVLNLMEETADEIAREATDRNPFEGSSGYVGHTAFGGYGGGRWVAYVDTTDILSMRAEAQFKTLSGVVTGE